MKKKPFSKVFALATGLSVLCAGSAVAAQSGETAATTPPKAEGKKDPSKRICRSERPTGSRLPTRICRTQAEWDAEADRIRNEMQRQQIEHATRQDTNVRTN